MRTVGPAVRPPVWNKLTVVELKEFFKSVVAFFAATINLNPIKSNTFINQIYFNIYLLITRHLVATLKTERYR